MVELKCWLLFFIISSASFSTSFERETRSGYLSANSQLYTSNNVHQEIQEYKFHDGEGSDFTCYKTTASFVVMTIIKDRKRISTGHRASSVSVYMKLSAANNNDILECAFYDQNYRKLELVSLRFIQDTQVMTFEVGVNGAILPRTRRSGDTRYYYEYRYYTGERLKVDFVKNDAIYGDESCVLDGNNIPVNLEKYIGFKMRILSFNTFTLNENNNGLFLECNIDEMSSRRHNIRVTFLSQTPVYNPYITGLSMSKVLFQYSNETSNTIVYNIGAETLNLFCSYTDYTDDRWSYSLSEVTSYKNQYRAFRLQDDHNNAIVKCSEKNSSKKTYLNLVRQSNDATITNIITDAFLPYVKMTTSRSTTLTTRPTTYPSTTRPTRLATQPTIRPITRPTTRPRTRPTTRRTTRPTTRRTTRPTTRPTTRLKTRPTIRPVIQTTRRPTTRPTNRSTTRPTTRPTSRPTTLPTTRPTTLPTTRPTTLPTTRPTTRPTTKRPATQSTTKPTNIIHPTVIIPRSTIVTSNTTLDAAVKLHPIVSSEIKNTASQPNKADKQSESIWIISICVLMLVLLVTHGLWIGYIYKKKKRLHRKNSSDLNCQNEPDLVDQAQRNPPDKVIYDEPILTTRFIPANSKRNEIEPTYANPKDSIIEPTYLNIQMNNEPTYSSVFTSEPIYSNEYQNRNIFKKANACTSFSKK